MKEKEKEEGGEKENFISFIFLWKWEHWGHMGEDWTAMYSW